MDVYYGWLQHVDNLIILGLNVIEVRRKETLGFVVVISKILSRQRT